MKLEFRTFVKKDKKMIYGRRAMAVKMFTPNYSYLDGEVEVTQFTGIILMDDIKVFEGDIVEDLIAKKRYEVIRDEFAGMFLFNPIGSQGNAIDYYEFEETHYSTSTIVIGNKFENPELLVV